MPVFFFQIILWTAVQNEVSCEEGDWQVTFFSINFAFLISFCVTPSGWSPNMSLVTICSCHLKWVNNFPICPWQQDFNHVGGFGNSPLIDTSNIPHQLHGGFAFAEELRCSGMGIVNYFWADLFLTWKKI